MVSVRASADQGRLSTHHRLHTWQEPESGLGFPTKAGQGGIADTRPDRARPSARGTLAARRIRCLYRREAGLQGEREHGVVPQLVQPVVVVPELLDQHPPPGRVQQVLQETGQRALGTLWGQLTKACCHHRQHRPMCSCFHVDDKGNRRTAHEPSRSPDFQSLTDIET